MAWGINRNLMCPGGCGHYLDETLDSSGEHKVKHVLCGACEARDLDAEDRKDEKPNPGELTVVVEDR